MAASPDLVIRNARILDGIGTPARFADIAIQAGRIVQVGRCSRGSTEFDARGLHVAPGFIDVHTHADDVADLPLAENFVRMGVTTVVAGNCGSSDPHLGALFSRLEADPVSVNFASLVGHNTVRAAAMRGSFMRPPNPAEMSQMKDSIDQAMRDGAVGLSTGLLYLPGAFAKTDELVVLAKVAAAHGGLYVSHMRDEGRDIQASLDELFTIARQAGIPAHVSHIKASTKAAWGQSEAILASIARARREGLDITQDMYVYTASSTGISQLIPSAAREGGRDEFIKRLHDPVRKAAITAEMKASVVSNGHLTFDYAHIAFFKADPSLNGLSIPQAAKRLRGSDSLDDQVETILDIEARGGAQGVFHSMQEDDLQRFLGNPNTMIASDSGVRTFGEGVPHPRGYGNNARLLARYVREAHLLTLEEAVRRMTSLPATVFGLRDRGLIREGFAADLVLFDPDQVVDQATFTAPHQYPTGIRHVLVNGVWVIRDGKHTGARPGQPIRHRSASAAVQGGPGAPPSP